MTRRVTRTRPGHQLQKHLRLRRKSGGSELIAAIFPLSVTNNLLIVDHQYPSHPNSRRHHLKNLTRTPSGDLAFIQSRRPPHRVPQNVSQSQRRSQLPPSRKTAITMMSSMYPVNNQKQILKIIKNLSIVRHQTNIVIIITLCLSRMSKSCRIRAV